MYRTVLRCIVLYGPEFPTTIRPHWNIDVSYPLAGPTSTPVRLCADHRTETHDASFAGFVRGFVRLQSRDRVEVDCVSLHTVCVIFAMCVSYVYRFDTR